MSNTNKEVVAPDVPVIGEQDIRNNVGIVKVRIRHQLWLTAEHVVEGAAGIVATAFLFVLIALMAVGLGYFTHSLAVVATWLPSWMFLILHGVEYLVFLADIAGLVWSVYKHIRKHF